VVITAASVQDRDGARPLLWNLHRACGKVLLVWADAGYTARKLAAWATALKITIEIVSKRDQHLFEVLPRRRVVDRTFAWISKHRRNSWSASTFSHIWHRPATPWNRLVDDLGLPARPARRRRRGRAGVPGTQPRR
jgi:transposase